MSASATTISAGGFTEPAFEAFLKDRDEPSWLIDRRREAFARFQAFAWPSARDEEWRRTDIRALQARRTSPRRNLGNPPARPAAAFDPLWETLSSHYATGIEHVNGAAVRHADPCELGGAVFLDLNQAVKEHPELIRRLSPHRGRQALRRHLRRPPRRLLDRRHVALRPQGG